MTLWDMISVVVLVGVIGGIIMERSKSKERLELARLRSKRDDGGEDSGRLARLEDRVRVLERLATDKREHLKEEIDGL
jgi:hypothetical protein